MIGHQRQSRGHGEKRQEEHEQAGETQNTVPASAFYTCEDKSATPGKLLRGCPCAAACSANCQPSLLAKAFQAPLGALWKSRLLRRSSVNILLCTMFMTSHFVWLFSMNRKVQVPNAEHGCVFHSFLSSPVDLGALTHPGSLRIRVKQFVCNLLALA